MPPVIQRPDLFDTYTAEMVFHSARHQQDPQEYCPIHDQIWAPRPYLGITGYCSLCVDSVIPVAPACPVCDLTKPLPPITPINGGTSGTIYTDLHQSLRAQVEPTNSYIPPSVEYVPPVANEAN